MHNYKLSDEILIKKFQNGDVNAYNEIVYRYKDRLLNFIYRFLNDIDRSEDLVQDTLLKLYTHKDSYQEIAKFSTWLYTIAANLAKTELRKKKTRKVTNLSQIGPEDKDYELPSVEPDTENVNSLLNTYSKTLAEFQNEEIIVLPKVKKSNRPNREKVHLEIKTNTKNYPAVYDMYLNERGDWKIINIVINGVNLGLVFRSQFYSLMEIHDNEIDTVINNWISSI